jgi:hypothetical protein
VNYEKEHEMDELVYTPENAHLTFSNLHRIYSEKNDILQIYVIKMHTSPLTKIR